MHERLQFRPNQRRATCAGLRWSPLIFLQVVEVVKNVCKQYIVLQEVVEEEGGVQTITLICARPTPWGAYCAGCSNCSKKKIPSMSGEMSALTFCIDSNDEAGVGASNGN